MGTGIINRFLSVQSLEWVYNPHAVIVLAVREILRIEGGGAQFLGGRHARRMIERIIHAHSYVFRKTRVTVKLWNVSRAGVSLRRKGRTHAKPRSHEGKKGRGIAQSAFRNP